jgi:thioredoxin-related protein
MKRIFFSALLILSLFLAACKKEEIDTSPQIADINSVGCLIANDFYAVHFSAYLKPHSSLKRER